jgi:hypothetical protein
VLAALFVVTPAAITALSLLPSHPADVLHVEALTAKKLQRFDHIEVSLGISKGAHQGRQVEVKTDRKTVAPVPNIINSKARVDHKSKSCLRGARLAHSDVAPS